MDIPESPCTAFQTQSESFSHVRNFKIGRINMLWTIFVVLGILWLLGFSLHVGGGLIHLLLVVALIVLVFNLLTGRRAV